MNFRDAQASGRFPLRDRSILVQGSLIAKESSGAELGFPGSRYINVLQLNETLAPCRGNGTRQRAGVVLWNPFYRLEHDADPTRGETASPLRQGGQSAGPHVLRVE